MTAVPEPKPVRELLSIDRRRLDEEIRPAGQPVVIRGLGAGWPSVQAAKRSPRDGVDYLLSFPATKDLSAIIGPPEIGGRFFYNEDMTGMNFIRSDVSLRTFFERLLRDQATARPHAFAIQSETIPDLLPGFVEDNHTELLDPAIRPRLWIGNAIRVATHYDLKENIGVVVMGRRRFTLFPPDQLPNLYMGPIELTPAGTPVSMVDIHAPDLERYPRYAEAAAHAQVALLEEGDGIYIPFHWWHAVDSLAPVNAFVNYWWNDAPPGVAGSYDALMHALYAWRGLPADQRAAWRMVLDTLVFADGDPVAHLPDHAKGVLGPITPTQLGRMRATLYKIATEAPPFDPTA